MSVLPTKFRLQFGFTLIELIIAIAITAFIGLGTQQLLSNMYDAKSRLESKGDQLKVLQRLMLWVSRDFEQMTNRSHINEYGDAREALYLNSEPPYLIEFTKNGWQQPPIAEFGRSEYQRVAYELVGLEEDSCDEARLRVMSGLPIDAEVPDGYCLIRYYWTMVDRAPDSEPKKQVLFDWLYSFDIEVFYTTVANLQGQTSGSNDNNRAQEGDWANEWPMLGGSDTTRKIRAVKVLFDVPQYGELSRVFEVAWDVKDAQK